MALLLRSTIEIYAFYSKNIKFCIVSFELTMKETIN